jgi:hypothetical protein
MLALLAYFVANERMSRRAYPGGTERVLQPLYSRSHAHGVELLYDLSREVLEGEETEALIDRGRYSLRPR